MKIGQLIINYMVRYATPTQFIGDFERSVTPLPTRSDKTLRIPGIAEQVLVLEQVECRIQLPVVEPPTAKLLLEFTARVLTARE